MASLSSYFVNNNKDLISNKASIVMGKNYRFTILTERLVRLEYNSAGIFEDRATDLVTFRNFSVPEFYVSETDFLLEIKTSYFTLVYDKEKPFSKTMSLKVTLNGTDKEWNYNHPDARNFGATVYSLDDFKGKLKLDKGLYSTDGFTVLDDSNSFIVDKDDNFVPREQKGIDLYLFMYKKDLGLCLRDYYTLTHYPSLIPRYALGNWWYKNENYSSVNIKNLVDKFNENKIPISVFMLGDKWHDNKNNFSLKSDFDIIEIKNALRPNDIKLGLTINPELGITTDDLKYNDAKQYLNANGNLKLLPLDMNKLGIYFNFYVRPLISSGIDIFNIDYKDKNMKKDLWLLDHYHFADSAISKRGLIMTRNANIAQHRYPILFTGKTNVDWETLSILPFYNLSASNIGVSWIAHAIGGYYNGIEDDELFMRYVQFGTFSPIFILASDAGKYYKREPWKWDTLKFEVIKEYMHLRNKLIPYIYSEAYNYSFIGSPLIQPLYYEYPKIYDEVLYRNEYYFGKSILIAPIIKRKNPVIDRVVQRVFLPKGTWYNFLDGKKYLGDKYYMNFYKDSEYPVFCKAGTIIPLSNDLSTNVPTNMEIQVFPGENGKYILTEDDGESNNYKFGSILKTELSYQYDVNRFALAVRKLEGSASSINFSKRNYKFVFRNINMPTNMAVKVNEKDAQYNAYVEKNDLIIELKDIDVVSNILIACVNSNLLVEDSRLINDDIESIISDLEIPTKLKEKVDNIMFSSMPIRKKRIAIRKLKRNKLEPKFIKMFISLLEYIDQV